MIATLYTIFNIVVVFGVIGYAAFHTFKRWPAHRDEYDDV